MTMYSGDRAAQSVLRARQGRRLRLIVELTRGHATPPGLSPRRCRGRGGGRGCGVLCAGEQGPGAGGQLGGGGGGGGLLFSPGRRAAGGGGGARVPRVG